MFLLADAKCSKDVGIKWTRKYEKKECCTHARQCFPWGYWAWARMKPFAHCLILRKHQDMHSFFYWEIPLKLTAKHRNAAKADSNCLTDHTVNEIIRWDHGERIHQYHRQKHHRNPLSQTTGVSCSAKTSVKYGHETLAKKIMCWSCAALYYEHTHICRALRCVSNKQFEKSPCRWGRKYHRYYHRIELEFAIIVEWNYTWLIIWERRVFWVWKCALMSPKEGKKSSSVHNQRDQTPRRPHYIEMRIGCVS